MTRYMIDDLVNLIMDYRGKTPKKLNMTWTENENDIIALSAKNIKNGRIVNTDKSHYGNKDLYGKWMKDGDIQVGDILMTSEAPLGETYLVKKPLKAILSQRIFLLRLDQSLVDPWYFYALMQSRTFREQLLSKATGTTVIGIKQKELRKIQIELPKISKQKKIGKYFQSLDAKLDINRQINANLVHLINTIYDNFCLKFPSVNQKKISDIFDFDSITYKVKNNKDKVVLHFSIPNFDNGKHAKLENTNNIKSNKIVMKPFSVLISKLNPRFQRIWAPNFNSIQRNTSIASPEFIQISGNSLEEQAVIFAITYSKNYHDFLISNATGSTNSRQRVKPSIATSYVIPFNSEKMSQLGMTLRSLLQTIQENEIESAYLQDIRAELLAHLF